jgi:hypothetical protein
VAHVADNSGERALVALSSMTCFRRYSEIKALLRLFIGSILLIELFVYGSLWATATDDIQFHHSVALTGMDHALNGARMLTQLQR